MILEVVHPHLPHSPYLCTMNTLGVLFRLTTFGESHGTAIGGVVDGCPAGLPITTERIQAALDRRKPGQSALTTPRRESDTVQLLSGCFENRTTGAPIGFIIPNDDAKSHDYDHLRTSYRPSHADYTWEMKYGLRDHRGGGRSSARETACRVAGGAIASIFLEHLGVRISAYVERVKDVAIPAEQRDRFFEQALIDANPVRCPHPQTAQAMEALIADARDRGDTVGGAIRCVIHGVPVGWGQPIFDKLHADLGKAMLSINAVKSFEIGSGTAGTYGYGSEQNDPFSSSAEGEITTTTNNSGGIQGGISNGQPITFSVAFKPVSTLQVPQSSVDRDGNSIEVTGKGRHDPCVLPRAVPIVEAMAALVLADHALRARADKA